MNKEIGCKSEELLRSFDESYSKLKFEGGHRRVRGILHDDLGCLLITACQHLQYSPSFSSIAPLESIIAASFAEDKPALVYCFYYNERTIGENALIFLIKVAEATLRMFAVETHLGSFYLCEYRGNNHANYGVVEPNRVSDVIAEKLVNTQIKNNARYKVSKTGDWGDKIIITLHGDGVRRHKKWCDNFDDGYCSVLCGKCIGSAHCDYYTNKHEENSHVYYLKKIGEGGSVEAPKDKLNPLLAWCEHYRLASYGDRLLRKIILIKNTPHTFRIGVVTSEDFYNFTVEYDGREHKYVKRIAYENSSVYVFDGIKELEDHGII